MQDKDSESENKNANLDKNDNTNINVEGPTMLWGLLKNKDVSTNDGTKLGKIKDITRNHIMVEKGTLHKERIWLPKYICDACDGDTIWLLLREDQMKSYLGEDEPGNEEYEKRLNVFKNSTHKKNLRNDKETENRLRIVEDYKNIRNIK